MRGVPNWRLAEGVPRFCRICGGTGGNKMGRELRVLGYAVGDEDGFAHSGCIMRAKRKMKNERAAARLAELGDAARDRRRTRLSLRLPARPHDPAACLIASRLHLLDLHAEHDPSRAADLARLAAKLVAKLERAELREAGERRVEP